MRGPALALTAALALGAAPARAHLLAPQQGTVNVVGASVFVAVSVPAAALGIDDDGDGFVDVGELERHEDAVRAAVDARLVVLDGATVARTVRVDLLLSPQHGAAADRSDQVMALKHVELATAPTDLRVRMDLFGQAPRERALTLTATRRGPGGARAAIETAVLTPDAPAHAFAFAPGPSPEAPQVDAPVKLAAAPWIVVAIVMAGVAGITPKIRRRSSGSPR